MVGFCDFTKFHPERLSVTLNCLGDKQTPYFGVYTHRFLHVLCKDKMDKMLWNANWP